MVRIPQAEAEYGNPEQTGTSSAPLAGSALKPPDHWRPTVLTTQDQKHQILAGSWPGHPPTTLGKRSVTSELCKRKGEVSLLPVPSQHFTCTF